ncbi:MAG TPA: beta-L-arabinofuranosidase domain-containing protein [Puia sp.]|nr:beta-L-arabinofuranosidase domain-containing protein [Puia sp.]
MLRKTIVLLLWLSLFLYCGAQSDKPANLAVVASPSGIDRYGGNYNELNDELVRTEPGEPSPGSPKPKRFSTWVQYDWAQPVMTDRIAVYWWDYTGTVPLPSAYHIEYWDGTRFRPVEHATGLGLTNNAYNTTRFDAVSTTRLRLEMDSADRWVAALLEWKVLEAPGGGPVPPVVAAGADRDVMLNGKTYLSGRVRSILPIDSSRWSKVSGPGAVTFDAADSLKTTATFSAPGNYSLQLKASQGDLNSVSTVMVKVVTPPPAKRLDVVYTTRYQIDNPLWTARFKALIVHWIPFCIDQIERSDLTTGQGGIDNFIEAAKALKGLPHGPHKGYVFSNAWVYQTVESMCEALMVDPQGDTAIIHAQAKMKATLERWIPIILSAQEADGYLQTAYTLRDTAKWHNRWTPESRGNHEGYTAGYFIESAINHYTLTEGRDRRLYDAAKRLAGCWVANIGPGKRVWSDGHQEMEQALVRFGRFVNDVEGQGRGDSYIRLAKFLLDSRGGGDEYDQSQTRVQEQYQAVGHAVRATYTYSGMADIAAEMHDVDYQSAVMSLWDNMVNRKYYITGGIGSGETSEGFGPDYSLRNDSYCESCSSCGLIFFEYKMNLAYHDARYADLYEETLYNALLGSLNLDGTDFYYTNALSTAQPRYAWHSCPCCVGNIPRTLLMMPTWTYVRGDDGIYVNLFVGSTIRVGSVAGTRLEMIQKTGYPWKPEVSITVNPASPSTFTVYVRVPNRRTSELYTTQPAVDGLKSISVNGEPVTPAIVHGYAVIRRQWKKGDRIDLVLPMQIQRVTADPRIAADSGRVALRYGPLIYNVEAADNPSIGARIGDAPLKLVWADDLLGGVMTIRGQWADGTPLIAIPNYARMNRVSPTPTPKSEWVPLPAVANQPPQYQPKPPVSLVWIKE